jgi:hypothetical protein
MSARIIKCVRLYVTWDLMSYPVSVSWMVAEEGGSWGKGFCDSLHSKQHDLHIVQTTSLGPCSCVMVWPRQMLNTVVRCHRWGNTTLGINKHAQTLPQIGSVSLLSFSVNAPGKCGVIIAIVCFAYVLKKMTQHKRCHRDCKSMSHEFQILKSHHVTASFFSHKPLNQTW